VGNVVSAQRCGTGGGGARGRKERPSGRGRQEELRRVGGVAARGVLPDRARLNPTRATPR